MEVSWDSIKNIGQAKPQITKDEYKCMQAVSDYDDFDGVEYIGMNGPSAQTGMVFLEKRPFSYLEEDSSWRFRSNFSMENLFSAAIEKRLQNESYQCIYVIINENEAPDIENLEKYNALLDENSEVFRSGSCTVRKLVFKPFKVYKLLANELIQKSEFVEADVRTYGTVALVNELEKNIVYTYKYHKPIKLSLIDITGRSIHDSTFIIRLFDEEKMVYEANISGFEKEILLDLEEGIVCRECELEVIGNRFSSSIIVDNITFMGTEAGGTGGLF